MAKHVAKSRSAVSKKREKPMSESVPEPVAEPVPAVGPVPVDASESSSSLPSSPTVIVPPARPEWHLLEAVPALEDLAEQDVPGVFFIPESELVTGFHRQLY